VASSKGYITSVKYFLQQHQLLRRTLVIISYFSALSILLFFKNFKNNIDIESVVYGIVIITIAINESFIYFGRRKRDEVLKELNNENSDKD
jgi:phosphoglycerol transferase MdoB-like AlkP superfamily enzyme